MLDAWHGLAFAPAGGHVVTPRSAVPAQLRLATFDGPGAEESGAAGGGLALCAGGLAVAWALLSVARLGRRARVQRRVNLKKFNDQNTTHQPRFRFKPGDKYKYWRAADILQCQPEFGVGKPECPDRVHKYGYIKHKGTPVGPEGFRIRLSSGGASAEQGGKGGEQGQMGKAIPGALLLDCDGTIVETERDGHRVAFNQAFKQKGYDFEWGVELYGELLTTGGGKERMARYFKDYNPDAWKQDDPPAKDHPEIVELHKLKTELFMDIVRSGSLPLREGIEDLIDNADSAGWKLGVCSTSNVEAVTTVIKTLLPRFADRIRIFAGDMVSKKKPDPEIYTMAAQEIGIAPMKCVVVEDAAIGVQAAKAAGMQVIVTKSIYSQDEDFGDANMIVNGADEVDFELDVLAMVPVAAL